MIHGVDTRKVQGKKVLLVSYPGYWVTANTFIADVSLATLAAGLRQHHVAVEVLDYQGPQFVGQVIDDEASPLGSAILAALQAGHRPAEALLRDYFYQRRRGQERLEQDIIKNLLAQIANDDVGLVGFKFWAGNGARGTLAMARAVKQTHPDVRVVAGGPAVHYLKRTTVDLRPYFDWVVPDDGEDALLYLATDGRLGGPMHISEQASGRHIAPATAYRNLNHVPMPCYAPSVYPTATDCFKVRIIDDSRGCQKRCAFCSHVSVSGPRLRLRDASQIVDQMHRSVEEEGIRTFRLAGSNPPWKQMIKIANEILRRGLDVRYSAFTSMSYAKAPDFPLLASSGLRCVLMGLESGDRELLRRVHNKDNGTTEHIVATARAAMQAGIDLCISMIVPSPFETAETEQASHDLIAAIFERHDRGSVVVFPPLLAPGSAWWDQPARYGFDFEPGYTQDTLLSQLIHADVNFLLPRDVAPTIRLRVAGAPYEAVLARCQAFSDRIERLGVVTNLDDAAYMVGRMSGLGAQQFKNMMTTRLVEGGQKNLQQAVTGVNDRAAPARPSSPRPIAHAPSHHASEMVL